MADRLEELTISCMRCGNCKPVCPILREMGDEASSPRGRVRLIKGVSRGELTLTNRYVELVGKCLNCRACMDECPSGVEPNTAVLAAREDIVRQKGLSPAKRVIFRKLLRARRMFPASAKFLGLMQRISFVGSRHSPVRLLLPAIGLPIDKELPVFAMRSFLDRVPETISPPERKYRVAYFVGCSANLLMPEVGEAVVGLLNRLGVEVVVPRDQMCCGTPVFNSGDFDGARYLARKNVSTFGRLDVDAIITSCPSCGLALRSEWQHVLELALPEGFAGKVYDFTEFLTDCLGVTELPTRTAGGSRITYHDPCHLMRGLRVKKQPRQLLASAGLELVELAELDKCCGGGGTFNLYHPDLARKVGKRKVDSVISTGAETVVTGCISCMMQIHEMLTLAGAPQRVEHTACVLWDLISGEE